LVLASSVIFVIHLFSFAQYLFTSVVTFHSPFSFLCLPIFLFRFLLLSLYSLSVCTISPLTVLFLCFGLILNPIPLSLSALSLSLSIYLSIYLSLSRSCFSILTHSNTILLSVCLFL
jgi:hypothetical protein